MESTRSRGSKGFFKDMPRSRRLSSVFKSKRSSRVLRAVSSRTRQRLFSSKKEKKDTGNEDYMEIIDRCAHDVVVEILQGNKWTEKYFVLRSDYLLHFNEKPGKGHEVVKHLVESIPLEAIEEVKVEDNFVTIYLGSRLKGDDSPDQKVEGMFNSFETSKDRFLKRHERMLSSERIKLRFKSVITACLFTKRLYQVCNKMTESEMGYDAAEMRTLGVNQILPSPAHQLQTLSKELKSFRHIACRYGLHQHHEEKDVKPLKVKYQLGGIPLTKEGFVFAVTLKEDRVESNFVSDIILPDEILEAEVDDFDEANGGTLDHLNDEVNIDFKLANGSTVFVRMERDILSHNKFVHGNDALTNKIIFSAFKMLYSLNKTQKNRARIGLYGCVGALTFLMFLLTGGFVLPLLMGVSVGAGIRFQGPKAEMALFNTFRPYYITHVSIRDADQELVETSAVHDNKSISHEEYVMLKHVRDIVAPALLLDEMDPDSDNFQIAQKHLEDFRLITFLRARNHNVVKASKMAEKALQWRMEYKADLLPDDDIVPRWLMIYMGCPAFLRRVNDPSLHPETFFRRDVKTGGYAALVRGGGLNYKKILKKVGNLEDIFRYLVWTAEFLLRDLEKLHLDTKGEVPVSVTGVVDLQNFKMADAPPVSKVIQLAKKYLPTLVLVYFDVLNRVLFFNTPTMFYTLWNIIKPLIPKQIADRFELRPKMKADKTLEAIQEYLDISDIPVCYGGELVIDGDETCTDIVVGQGPRMPDGGKELLARDKN